LSTRIGVWIGVRGKGRVLYQGRSLGTLLEQGN